MGMIPKITAMMLTLCIAANASANEYIDGIEYALSPNGEATVVGCNKSVESAVIPFPLEHNGKEYTVTVIERSAFAGCHSLKSLIIPSSVTEIQDYAFYACDALTSISIPSSVKFMGKCAFFNCFMLESVELSDALPEIRESTFYGCMSLASVEIPSSVIRIGESAFEKCFGLVSVQLPPAITYIAEMTFFDCYSLTDIAIPSTVKTIGRSAFSECHAMTSVIIPASVTEIKEFAFYACDALKTVTIPSSVVEIGRDAFWNCASLESVYLSESLTEISRGTFYGCKSLTSVVIPSSTSRIGESAFEKCFSLNTSVLPASLSRIDEGAFKDCEALSTIVLYPDVPPVIYGNVFLNVPVDAVVYVPAGTLETYPVAEGWTVFHDFRELGSIELTINCSQLDMQINDRFTLSVDIAKAYDVVIESESWMSSNTEVAVVEEGVVTAVGEGTSTISFVVIDGSGCPHMVSCDVFVEGMADIEEISSDDEEPEFYNLNGVRVNRESMTRGIYIKRQGNRSARILIKQ